MIKDDQMNLPDSLIKVFPAWAYCQLWLSSTAILNQNWSAKSKATSSNSLSCSTSSFPSAPLLYGDKASGQTTVPWIGQRPITHWATEGQKRCQLLLAFTNWLFFAVAPNVTNPSPKYDLVTNAAFHSPVSPLAVAWLTHKEKKKS